ncbi:hypothetical protein BUALT_Bualt16G0130800 [Buddleja alternifolia]|uniref:TORTIFOLIA1/SINE1-2 N-terminal domain-containing protein n=1 Tax=Buddleja alternifolia TaxID=168488 RepID=A0AAV6WKI9_9LAMI|nr:hypothetical protein BUALT_Bualt16G0130800 [Buddleja alternifolia]
MGKTISPLLRRELENLDDDADNKETAMRALKSYVKDLDSTAIPVFLAQVSEIKQTDKSFGEHTISLYEVLARVHGPNIVPQIDNIMNTIIKTLSSSAGAFALHQACSKVVPAIARYAMDPMTADHKKKHVIHSLCKPLSDCLLGSQENLSSGAALCLQALVESDNWRFASNEMVNEVCQRVAGALEKHSQTNSHVALVTALAKHNAPIVEAYVRLLIRTGLQILDAGFTESNSQKQLSSLHMVSSLMRCLDPKSMLSELELVIKKMENFPSDQMPLVTAAAFKVLQIAKKVFAAKSSMFERDMGSPFGRDFDRRENTRRNVCGFGDQSPLVASPESQIVDSPESQIVDSFLGYDYFTDSPISRNQGHRGIDCEHRRVNRKLWRRCENGGLDVSLEDGIFSEIIGGNGILTSEHDEFSQKCGDYCENSEGFVSARNRIITSNTPSPQRSNSHINGNELKIFTTPRRLIHSLQDPDDFISSSSKKQIRRFISPTLSIFPTSMHEQNGLSQKMNRGKSASDRRQLAYCSESVSSTEDLFTDTDLQLPRDVIPGNKTLLQSVDIQKDHLNSGLIIFCGIFFVVFAVFLCLLGIGDQIDHYIVVPT